MGLRTRLAMDFLEGALPGGEPWCCFVSVQEPHDPFICGGEAFERYDADSLPLSPSCDDDLEGRPGIYRKATRVFAHMSDRQRREAAACYYASITEIDQQFGRLIDRVEAAGQLDRTLVVFTSDHGELLGDHGLWMKGPFHYEQLIRVPMIVRWPEGIPGGRKEQGLFSLVDIVPTALTAAGLELDESVDGVNSLPLLRGESKTRDDVLVECIDDPNKLRLKTIVTENRKLTWYRGQSYGELYDLETDPREKVNHCNNPDYAADKSDLLTRIPNHLESLEPRAERYSYA